MVELSRRDLLAALGALAFMGGSGLSSAVAAAPGVAGSDLSLVATTGMLADAVRTVGGPRVAVTALMGQGVDPHAYRQTRSDIAAMVRADAVFAHGLYLEAQLEDFLMRVGEKKPARFVVEDALPPSLLIAHDEYKNRFDPHVWMDPRLWLQVVSRLALDLAALHPAGADGYRARAAAYATEIDRLAAYGDSVLQSVPPASRVLVTAHDAFRYLGRAHGFEVLGIQGISTESEAGLARVEELVTMLVDRRIAAIFVESSVPVRNVRALIEGASARGHAVKIGGELFSDAMGKPGTYEGTYLGMIDHNVTTIARALGGTVPPGGMLGRLATT